VTVNLANLPASAGDKAVVVPVEAVFNRIIASAMSPTSG
jgi:hypothetical protein